MTEKKIGNPEHYPEFTTEKFSALCNELKQLYVGISRVRQDLFIVDEDEKVCIVIILIYSLPILICYCYFFFFANFYIFSPNKTHQPMLDYWTALGYVNRVSTMDHPAITKLAQKSAPEKWQSEVW
jgi:hypothetical protein